MMRLLIGLIGLLTALYIMTDTVESSTEREANWLIQQLERTADKCLGRETIHICKAEFPSDRKPTTTYTRYCWRYVKLALVRSYLVSEYPRTSSAVYAGSDLKREGFKNIIAKGAKPHDAPYGAVLVYRGGKHGHVEVKGTGNWFYSDYIAIREPDDDFFKRRTLIGIWIKGGRPE